MTRTFAGVARSWRRLASFLRFPGHLALPLASPGLDEQVELLACGVARIAWSSSSRDERRSM